MKETGILPMSTASGVAGRMKRLAEQILIESGAERFARSRLRGDVLLLAYHNVLPEGESPSGDRSLHLNERDFAEQMDAVAETHEVIPLSSISDPPGARPRIVITFDDAYLGAITAGTRVLGSRNLPATIFLAPALLGAVTWWDLLADRETGEVPAERRHDALEVRAGRRGAVLDRYTPHPGVRLENLPRIGTEEELAAVSNREGITFGSHSWSHPNLAVLAAPDVREELERPLAWLRERFSCVVPWLSYPYGRFNSSVVDAARAAGYAGAFRIEGGRLDSQAMKRPFELARLNVPAGVSTEGFRLRVAGELR